MSLYEDAINWMKRQVTDGGRFANPYALSRHLSTDPSQLNSTLAFERIPKADRVFSWLETLGVKIVFPDEVRDTTKEVVFVTPIRSGENGHLPPPEADKYRAIPLTSAKVAAGPGIINPDTELESWVLIFTGEQSIATRTSLIAVRVGKNQKSMLPSIRPNDIVVVDLEDKTVTQPGIFLVRDPEEGEALKRVKYFTRKGKEMLTFYSDNAMEGYEPMTYAIDDFRNGLDEAIVGRCVWQWGDLTRR